MGEEIGGEGQLVLVKLGGSVITHKDVPKSVNEGNIARLGRELKNALSRVPVRLVIGTGGGSYPHRVAKEYAVGSGLFRRAGPGAGRPPLREGALKGFALTQSSAAELNHLVVAKFLELDLPVLSLQPSAFLYCRGGVVEEVFMKPLENLLGVGAVPVLYGDAVTDTTKGCTIASTEVELAAVARALGGGRLVLCTDVDGVFTGNPHVDPGARLIPEITPHDFESIRGSLSSSHAVDVTGGMLHKVEALVELAREGIESVVINGNTPGALWDALLGKVTRGTTIRGE
ncbi:MAG: isopentenyl phosphate kinase [Promethearchaeota archaeon]